MEITDELVARVACAAYVESEGSHYIDAQKARAAWRRMAETPDHHRIEYYMSNARLFLNAMASLDLLH